MDRSRRFVDLHTHSWASDGSLAPGELVRQADQAGLAAVALTDHDTVAGIAEAQTAAAEFPELTLVPGIEISAIFPHGTLHILGLGIDPDSPVLAQALADFKDARDNRNPLILQKLAELGMTLSMDEVLAAARRYSNNQQPAGQIIGRVHIAQAMLARGFARSINEAFDKYIGSGKVAYVDKERLTPRQAIQTIHNAGGVAILAHPPQLKYENSAQLLRILQEFTQAGLDGIEAYHSDNSPEQTRLYVDLAHKLNMGTTGGSDFHGSGKPHVRLGQPRVSVSMIGQRFRRKLLGAE